MENLLAALISLIYMMISNFWQIFLIIILLISKNRVYNTTAIFLIFHNLGYPWYWYLLMFFIIILALDYAEKDDNVKLKLYYENKIKDLEDKLKDPDYK